MPDSACGPLDALLILLVALLAVVRARRLARRRACRKCGAFDSRRAWQFCARCGAPRGGGEAGATPPGTKAATAPPLAGGPIALPSDFLRRGWSREPALNDCGCEVDPCAETAVAWSILGACDRAFSAYSAPWRAWRKALGEIMAEQFGGVSAVRWARHRTRRHHSVVELAQAVETRAGLARHDNRSTTKAATAR